MNERGWSNLKISQIRKVQYDKPIPVYDVVGAEPYNNFLIKANRSYLVSHNCGIL